MSGAEFVKRFFDIVLSALGLLVLGLPLLFLTWQVRRKLGRPAFFRQVRPGLHGRPFRMVKFRSMTRVAPTASCCLMPSA